MATYFERRFLGTTEYYRINEDGKIENWLRPRADPPEPKWEQDHRTIAAINFSKRPIFFEGSEEDFISILEEAQ